MVTIEEMKKEYEKGGKFNEFINKSCRKSGDSFEMACRKVIVQEYYKSVVDGVNKEK